MYQHGFFSASIKLPSDYTAGVVVAFYVRPPPLPCSYIIYIYLNVIHILSIYI